MLQCQWFAQSKWGTRRACAGAAPSMHGVDNDAQSQNVRLVSGLISVSCAIHMGPLPDTDATDLHGARDCHLPNAGPLPFVPIGAIRVHGTAASPTPNHFQTTDATDLHEAWGQQGGRTGVSPDTRQTHGITSPWITLLLSRKPPASSLPRSITQAYGQRSECSFLVFEPL